MTAPLTNTHTLLRLHFPKQSVKSDSVGWTDGITEWGKKQTFYARLCVLVY